MTSAIRIVIADDHSVLREGLVALLDSEPDIVVVGQAADGVGRISGIQPDGLEHACQVKDHSGADQSPHGRGGKENPVTAVPHRLGDG